MLTVAFSGCAPNHGGPPPGGLPSGDSSRRARVTEQSAYEAALKALRSRGVGSGTKIEADYDVSVEDEGPRWKFRFVGKARVPGSEHVVFVSKASGETEVMLGE